MPARRESRARVLEKLRAICLSLPESRETAAWGDPHFRAGKKNFAAFHEDGNGSPCIWVKVDPAVQLALRDDERVSQARHGGLHWIGLRADLAVDWEMARELVVDSYRLVALKRMVKELDRRSSAVTGQRG